MKLKLSLALAIFLPVFAYASSHDCVKSLYEFGRYFSPTQFGKGAMKKIWEEPNPYGAAGEKLTFTSLSLKGSWITTLECPSCSKRKVVIGLMLTTKRNLPCGLQDGMTEKEIIQRLGSPDEKKENNLIYFYPPLEQNEEITLYLANGKLNAIEWHFYFE
jgi:hypothetical protein